MVNKLWDLESLGIKEEDQVHETLIDNVCFTGQRYRVGLPSKVGQGDLPSNYEISLMRLQNQINKLRKDPDSMKNYDQIIREQELMGIIERVPAIDNVSKMHYLAHQAVIRDEAETTKVRIVFDASCKARKSGMSLNDCLHVGPPMTPLIFDLPLRFRDNNVAIIGYLGNKHIQWKFNLERSPWWGGNFERMVGQVKRYLRKLLGNARLALEELYTVLTEVENTPNSRPLTYDYDEPGVEMLTPSHLIFGRRLSALAEGIQQRVDKNVFDNISNLHKRF